MTPDLPPSDTGACGEDKGYYRHRAKGEQTCPACRKAHADEDIARKNGKERTTRTRDIVEEVDHLIFMRQGTGYILKAINERNPLTLARKLHRAGRHDLARRFDNKEERGAA